MDPRSCAEITRLLSEESVAERRYFAASMAPDAPELWRAWRDASEATWSAQRAACADFARAHGWRLGECFPLIDQYWWYWDAFHHAEFFWTPDGRPAAAVFHTPAWERQREGAEKLGGAARRLPASWYDPSRSCVLFELEP
jgi:hypothetical protein